MSKLLEITLFFSNVYNFLARSIIKKLNHNHDFSFFFLQKSFEHHARPHFRAVNSNFVNFLFESNAEGGLSNKNPSWRLKWSPKTYVKNVKKNWRHYRKFTSSQCENILSLDDVYETCPRMYAIRRTLFCKY